MKLKYIFIALLFISSTGFSFGQTTKKAEFKKEKPVQNESDKLSQKKEVLTPNKTDVSAKSVEVNKDNSLQKVPENLPSQKAILKTKEINVSAKTTPISNSKKGKTSSSVKVDEKDQYRIKDQKEIERRKKGIASTPKSTPNPLFNSVKKK